MSSLRIPVSRTVLAMILALLVVALVEGLVRLSLGPALAGWDYWSQTAANKYITYFRLQQEGRTPRVLVVGDSSADYGFSPSAFNQEMSCDHCAYNLATLGNFAFSFDRTINDIVLQTPAQQPEYLFILFTRGGFEKRSEIRSSENSILHSPFVKAHQGETTPGQVMFLLRVWRARQQLLDYLQGKPVINADRGYQARNDQSGGPIEKPAQTSLFTIDEQRLAVLEHALQICREKGIRPVVVHPPLHAFEALQWQNPEAYSGAVSRLCAQYGTPFWDYSTDRSYDEYMRDYVHLNKEGADLFSAGLARRFQQMEAGQ